MESQKVKIDQKYPRRILILFLISNFSFTEPSEWFLNSFNQTDHLDIIMILLFILFPKIKDFYFINCLNLFLYIFILIFLLLVVYFDKIICQLDS